MTGFYCRRIPPLFLGALVAIAMVQQTLGQTSQDLDRADLLRPQPGVPAGPTVATNGVDDGYAVASPNDPDLGEQQILKHAEQYQPFSVSVGAPFYWTSNVALTNSGVESDFIVAPSAGVSYAPQLSKRLYGFVGVSEQLFFL